ncbi:hypothetical protein [Streptomyces cellostaticus]|nr:hypothetical protein [Streptomyces cellostaticus]
MITQIVTLLGVLVGTLTSYLSDAALWIPVERSAARGAAVPAMALLRK